MMENDLISVIIPAFNHEKYIEECIDSIINQTYKNIELIVLNDGSIDRTSEKIKSKAEECSKRFKRFLFIDKENEGIPKTLNKGCFKSKGKFLAFCASDDTYTCDAIEVMYKFLKINTDYVLAVGNNYFIDEQSKICFWDSNGEITYNIKDIDSFSFGSYLMKTRKDVDFYSDEFGNYISLLKGNYIPNGYLLRKNTFVNKIKGYSEKPILDDYFLHLQLSKFGKYKYIDKHLFNYRCHKKNTIKNRDSIIQLTKNTIELEKEYAYKFGYQELFDAYMKRNIFLLKIKYKISKFKKIYNFLKNFYLKIGKLSFKTISK